LRLTPKNDCPAAVVQHPLKDFKNNPTRLLAQLTGGVTVASSKLSFFLFKFIKKPSCVILDDVRKNIAI
jgi:hypothetical protein